MPMTNLAPEVQVKLVDHAWDAVKGSRQPGGDAEVQIERLIKLFSQLVDGLAKGVEGAGDK